VVFAHDTEAALLAAVALVNSAEPPDTLTTPAQLDTFFVAHRYTGNRTHDDAELATVRALRAPLRALLTADRDAAVAQLNAILAERRAVPQLVRHDGWDYHLHATPPEADLHVRMMVEFAMAVVDVIRLKELDRLRTCAAEDCEDVLVDLTKNRSRRFCEGGCGNRANVAAYRARRAGRGNA